MELVDIYDNKHELTGLKKKRKELENGEYRLSCFVWIINDNNELLIQQRLATAKKCPNMWETCSGGAISGDTPITGVIREIEEELGLKVDKDNLTFIGSFIRIMDYVEVFVLKENIDINDITIQEDEVQAVKWVSILEFEKMIEEGIVSSTSYFLFKEYFNNYYNKYCVFVDGKPVVKSVGE